MGHSAGEEPSGSRAGALRRPRGERRPASACAASSAAPAPRVSGSTSTTRMFG